MPSLSESMAVKNKVTKIAITMFAGTFKYPINRQKTMITAKTIAISRGIPIIFALRLNARLTSILVFRSINRYRLNYAPVNIKVTILSVTITKIIRTIMFSIGLVIPE